MKALTEQGVEVTILGLLEGIYKTHASTRTFHKECLKFPTRKGVRQGDNISPNYLHHVQRGY